MDSGGCNSQAEDERFIGAQEVVSAVASMRCGSRQRSIMRSTMVVSVDVRAGEGVAIPFWAHMGSLLGASLPLGTICECVHEAPRQWAAADLCLHVSLLLGAFRD